MTREEAIRELKADYCGNRIICELHQDGLCNTEDCEIWLAIKALEAQPDGDVISRRSAIDALRVAYWDDKIQSAKDDPCIVDAMTDWAIRQVKALPSVQPDNSCDGCRYENADDGVLVPCGFCKRSHPDNYERRTDEKIDIS